MFDGELALLEIRLTELWSVVDHFVVCEAASTPTGAPKPLHFDVHKERFARFASKIHHVVSPRGDRASQRDAMMDVIRPAPDHDVILLSDIDEIPRCGLVYRLRFADDLPRDTYGVLKMQVFQYNFRWTRPAAASAPARLAQLQTDTVAKAFYRRYADTRTLSAIATAHALPERHWFIDHAGWHCAYCFSPEKIRTRLLGLGMLLVHMFLFI